MLNFILDVLYTLPGRAAVMLHLNIFLYTPLLLWAYIFATLPTNKLVVLVIDMVRNLHPSTISNNRLIHTHPDLPGQDSHRQTMASTHLTVATSLYYVLGRFFSFPSFSADEKRTTPRDGVLAELPSVTWLGDERLNHFPQRPSLSNLFLQRAWTVHIYK